MCDDSNERCVSQWQQEQNVARDQLADNLCNRSERLEKMRGFIVERVSYTCT